MHPPPDASSTEPIVLDHLLFGRCQGLIKTIAIQVPPPNDRNREDSDKGRDVDQQSRMNAKKSEDHIEKTNRHQRPQIDRRHGDQQCEDEGRNPTQEETQQKAVRDHAINPNSKKRCWTS